jgi:type III restriction enzyme
MFPIKDIFKEEASKIKLPMFFKKVSKSSFFEQEGTYIPLTKTLLLEGFDLDKQEHNIDFTLSSSNMASVDLEEGRKNEYTPQYKYVSPQLKEAFVEYISTLSPEGKIKELSGRLTRYIRNIDEIPEQKISEYIQKSIKDFNSEKIAEISANDYFYANKIKDKIRELTDKYAEKQFSILLDKGTIVCNPSFEFSEKISPKNTVKGITKNLYVEEGEMNDFEKSVIFKIANLDSVEFWHRNLERGKGFVLNGFINHYPDFIIKMKNGKIILIETKGDDRDNSDSERKLKLGKIWESKAGENYRYFMVFNKAKLDGARTVDEVIEILKDMN